MLFSPFFGWEHEGSDKLNPDLGSGGARIRIRAVGVQRPHLPTPHCVSAAVRNRDGAKGEPWPGALCRREGACPTCSLILTSLWLPFVPCGCTAS